MDICILSKLITLLSLIIILTLNTNRYTSEIPKYTLYLFIYRTSISLIYNLHTNLFSIKILLSIFLSSIASGFQNGGLMWSW